MSETLNILMELLNEYRLSECALDEGRVSWYAARLDGRTVNERWMNGERTEEGAAMSITDKLRKWVNERFVGLFSSEWVSDLNAIADRIDEQYAKERIKVYDKGVYDGIDADKDAMGYVKLPVDADGVPIHVGDVMDVGIVFAIGDEGVFMVENGFSGKYDVECFDGFACHHVKPDSWERIIADAANYALDTQHTAGRISLKPFVERCKRLAGEGA